MPEPSIKGSTLTAVVDDVCRLRAEGRISQSELEVRLAPEDIALLEQKVQPALWYPIECYRRLSELLLECEGDGRWEYIEKRGERAGERLFDAGVYVQLQHGEERAQQARSGGREFRERDGRLMATLSGAIFNFGHWEFGVDPDDPESWRILVTGAADLPEVGRYAAKGFLKYTVSRLNEAETSVHSERLTPDRIVFRFDRRPS